MYHYCPEHRIVEEAWSGGCPHPVHHYPISNENFQEKPHLQGWECPKCGSVYGPFVQICGQCRNSNIQIIDSPGTSESVI